MKEHDQVKDIYDKMPVYNMVLNGDRLRDFPFKYVMRQVFLVSPLLINTVFSVLLKTSRKEIKGLQIRTQGVHM